ncbi:uncharacterized protein LOC114120244 [Aphis gossypii]|uniref:uncharacterized protein LOC114120244 n=1 Tax=Aphis gossypii TaxID=80765 RepID=UPI0021598B35|nr:uncharacterized protein LOC114120244 [Aphis gossypii]
MAAIIKMLKLFLLITTLMTLVRSELDFEWMCEGSDKRVNCSALPQFADFLSTISDNLDNSEYSDYSYCPFKIADRYSECIISYYNNCYTSITEDEKIVFLMNMPLIGNSKTLCAKDKPYKKEFRKHLSCMKALSHDDLHPKILLKQVKEYLAEQQLQYQTKSEDDLEHKPTMNDQIELRYLREVTFEKCQIRSEYIRLLYILIQSQCGLKTEKFFRQLYSNVWPMPAIMKNCDKQIYYRI